MESALRQQHAAAGEHGTAVAPRRIVAKIAGDIKGEQQLLGHGSTSSTWNCVLCLAKLNETYKAGIPHLRNLPEPWASQDARPPDIINPPPRGGTAEMAENAQRYADKCAEPKAPKTVSTDAFKSCVNPPLFRSDDLIEHIAQTPLHVTLGLGTNYLKAVEHRCAQLDQNWALNVADDSAIASWHEAEAAVFVAMEGVEDIMRDIDSKKTGIEIVLQKDPKAGRTGKVDPYADSQKDCYVIKYRALREKVKELESKLKAAKGIVTAAEKVERLAKEMILKLTPEGAGPFGKAFQALLDEFKVSMKKYFGGTYIGPDLHKIFGQVANIRKLCDLFKRRQLKCPSGELHAFGDDAEADALFSCLRPFGALHLLFNRTEPLCDHELELFSQLVREHAIAFATVFPTTVPTLKMHILSMHMDELLERHGSIGMDTEQGIECYHPEVTYILNQFRMLDRRPEEQLVAVYKQACARGAGKRERGAALRDDKHARNEKARKVVKLEKGK